MATMPQLPQIRPVETPDVIGEFGKVVALKNALQQQAFQRQYQPLQLQEAQTNIRTQQLQQQQVQRQIDDAQIITGLYHQNNGDVNKTWDAISDPNSGVSAIGAMNFMKEASALQQQRNQMSESDAKAANEAHQLFGPPLQDLSQTTDPQDFQRKAGQFVQLVNSHPSLLRYAPHVPSDPTQITPQWIQDALAQQTTWEQIDKNRTFLATHGPLTPDQVATAQNDFNDRYAQMVELHKQFPTVPLPPASNYQLSQLKAPTIDDYQRMHTNLQQVEQAMQTQAFREQSLKQGQQRIQISMGTGTTPLSDPALDQAAERYSTTGQLPPQGRGLAGLNQTRAIINRAAQLHPGQVLTANSAEYSANKKSLDTLQPLYDKTLAFENTAQKNMDLAQKLGQDIPDLGVKFANTPLRSITADMIGAGNMAAFKTALQTAKTEAARVLANAAGTGVLTQEQQNEMTQIMNGDLPYNSMVRVFDTLRTDMANRRQSYTEQINDIKARLQSTTPGQQGATSGKVINYKIVNGQLVPQ